MQRTETHEAPSRALLRSRGPDAYIFALIASFPCLSYKLPGMFQSGKFEVNFWMDAAGPWSHGEKLCAAFVANVWNPGFADSQGWRFDIFEAVGTWDPGNRAAALAWIASPVWP